MDDSEWDIDSFDKISLSDDMEDHQSRQKESELKTLAQAYLRGTGLDYYSGLGRNRHSGLRSTASMHSRRRLGKVTNVIPKRETIIHATDDPVIIHKGALLEFKTKR